MIRAGSRKRAQTEDGDFVTLRPPQIPRTDIERGPLSIGDADGRVPVPLPLTADEVECYNGYREAPLGNGFEGGYHENQRTGTLMAAIRAADVLADEVTLRELACAALYANMHDSLALEDVFERLPGTAVKTAFASRSFPHADCSVGLDTLAAASGGGDLTDAAIADVPIALRCGHQPAPRVPSSAFVFITCLHIVDVERLTHLPEAIGDLRQLRYLRVRRCDRVRYLPDRIGDLSRLECFHVGWCNGLVTLPDRIGDLKRLRALRIEFCFGLRALPDRIGDLGGCLQSLYIVNCGLEHFDRLPDRIGDLKRLQSLLIAHCGRLTHLPDTIGDLEELVSLAVEECSVTTLPERVGDLANLRTLVFGGDVLPRRTRDLKRLERMVLSIVSSVPTGIGGCSRLRTLVVDFCDEVTTLPDQIGECEFLETIRIELCINFAKLPDRIGDCKRLQTLVISDCSDELTRLPERIGDCTQLQTIHIDGADGLETLPGRIVECARLREIRLKFCGALTTLPDGVGDLAHLSSLTISGCVRLTALPENVGRSERLKSIALINCPALSKLPSAFCEW